MLVLLPTLARGCTGREPRRGSTSSLPQLFPLRAGSWLDGDSAPGPALHWGYSKMCSSEGAGVQQAALPAPHEQGCAAFPTCML